MHDPYVGVLGWQNPEQVKSALNLFPTAPPLRLMIGVQTDSIPTNIFQPDQHGRTWNLVHHGDIDESTLTGKLIAAHRNAHNPSLVHGAHLELDHWPNQETLIAYRQAIKHGPCRVVLVVGEALLAQTNKSLLATAKLVARYADGTITDAVVRVTTKFTLTIADTLLSHIRDHAPNLGIGLIGGRGELDLGQIKRRLLCCHPSLSITLDLSGSHRPKKFWSNARTFLSQVCKR